MRLEDLKGYLGFDFIELVFFDKDEDCLYLEVYKNEVENNGYYRCDDESVEGEMFEKHGECEIELMYSSFNHELGEDVLSIDLK